MDTPNNVEQVHSIDQVPSVTQPVSPPTTSPDSGTNLGAPAPGPGMSKKALIIILISAFVLAGISYGGIWYWQNQQVAQEVAPTFTPQPSVSATLDATADWKTYTNTQYGFEFKYPDNRFSILASGSSVFLITPTSQEKVLRVSSIPHAPAKK